MKTLIRFGFDRIYKAAIKLAMLTGVTFTMTACYGTPPVRYIDDEAFQADTQRVEDFLVPAEEQPAE